MWTPHVFEMTFRLSRELHQVLFFFVCFIKETKAFLNSCFNFAKAVYYELRCVWIDL